MKNKKKNSIQEIILKLEKFWISKGCILLNAYDIEKGAGTMSPYTFLKAIGPEPWNVIYIEPSRRPVDGRYNYNPNRLYQHNQIQVIMKPSPLNIQNIYLESLKILDINFKKHDIRFIEDNWKNPSLGCIGVGWEVRLDGMEITQFTYFQQVGEIKCEPITIEITYGLERLASYIQNVSSVYELEWGNGILYKDIFKQFEYENSKYSFEISNINMLLQNFILFEKESEKCIKKKLIFPAYDYLLKCSHIFNLLDARKVISSIERISYLNRMRNISKIISLEMISYRKSIGFPLLKKGVF